MKPISHFLAIDPGEVHVGFASLTIEPSRFILNGGVLHRPSRDFARLVDELTSKLDHSMVLVESYQQRAVGHQRFAAGETLQLIGALRYVVERRSRLFATIMPGNAKKDLRAMKLEPLLDLWIPHPRPSKWEHSFSAWRVLGRFLLGHETEKLMQLVKEDAWKDYDERSTVQSTYKHDLIAPTLKVDR